jgi:hypothetical protein
MWGATAPVGAGAKAFSDAGAGKIDYHDGLRFLEPGGRQT